MSFILEGLLKTDDVLESIRGRGSNAYQRVLRKFAKVVQDNLDQGKDMDSAVEIAMEKYSKDIHSFPDFLVRHDLENKVKHQPTTESVISKLDLEDLGNTEVLILGGAGSYTLQSLHKKAKVEAEALAKDIEKGLIEASAYNIKQLSNTLNTLVAAYNEIEQYKSTSPETNKIKEYSAIMKGIQP